MKNEQKYRTAWLALEAEEEKPEPCPFCGCECSAELVTSKESGTEETNTYYSVICYGRNHDGCGYSSQGFDTEADAIAAHNRVARAVRAAKGSEVVK